MFEAIALSTPAHAVPSSLSYAAVLRGGEEAGHVNSGREAAGTAGCKGRAGDVASFEDGGTESVEADEGEEGTEVVVEGRFSGVTVPEFGLDDVW